MATGSVQPMQCFVTPLKTQIQIYSNKLLAIVQNVSANKYKTQPVLSVVHHRHVMLLTEGWSVVYVAYMRDINLL